jgi:hypothetical protein
VFRYLPVLSIILGSLLTPTLAMAQSDGPPLLPIIYNGTVYLDGVLASGQQELTLRVRGWESNPAVVQEGEFQSLIVGPPDISYADEAITFWMNGLQASQEFTLTDMMEPKIETVHLYFTTVPTNQMTTPISDNASPSSREANVGDDNRAILRWVVLGIGGLILAAGLGVWRPGFFRRS